MKTLDDLKRLTIKPPFKLGDCLSEKEAMEVAIYEAYKGQGRVSPNPLVGCSVLDAQGRLLGLGHHEAFGEDHAEIHALKNLLSSSSTEASRALDSVCDLKSFEKTVSSLDTSVLKGAHVFVTLEPCSFQGKTPSCAECLSRLPIQSVTYGLLDPHRKVQGRGVEILQAQGKEVKAISERDLIEEIEDLTEVFLHNMKNEKAFLALKIASSLDGQIALQKKASFFFHHLDGSQDESKDIEEFQKKMKREEEEKKEWITNEEAREYGHFLRGCYDAILIGYGTLIQDNPSLNVRHSLFPEKRNKVLLIDSEARSLPFLHKTKMVECHNPEDIFVVIKESRFSSNLKKEFPFHVLPCREISVPLLYRRKIGEKSEEECSFSPPLKGQRESHFSLDLDLDFLMKKLYELSIASVYVEGGGGVHSSFLRQNQVQRVFQFLSPILLGARFAQPWTKNLALSSMKEKISLQRLKIKMFNDNILLTGKTNF